MTDQVPPMTPSKPYLIRAFYEWIVDNGVTPYLLVDAEMENVEVPLQYVNNGQIVLNLSPTAIQGLNMDNEWVSFSARFSGRAMEVFVPIAAVLAIYARENGQGMAFQGNPQTAPADTDTEAADTDERPSLEAVRSTPDPEAEAPSNPPPRPKGRPTLTVVK